MKRLKRTADLRALVADWRREGLRVGLVPTMGNLHEGHLALAEYLAPHCDRLVTSIFVNPLQFGPNEDYESYPRTFGEDCAGLEARGVDAVFAPPVEEMYRGGVRQATRVEVGALAERLCGISRPGHFTGVATVVVKLFNLVQPDVAVFGRKDYQQLRVIEQVVSDLNIPVEVRGMPTVREPDGLAMSSRNGYLTQQERHIAPGLYRTLQGMAKRIRAGDDDYRRLEARGRAMLAEQGFQPDYLEVCRADDLTPAAPGDRGLVVAGAAWLGRARLIDNIELELNRDQ
ncbi:pantoate--beta-alanine ligase [Alkalilimnicola ehrlichii MLHE-1]|uniref:Pantothenate synthetase n=1 Tax=Alkalilimnicola ehrlichii (strain ATCC BAA-1101 / DSM 17681 / MLHE-1) TaxID=187272 RepID=PANC_ALKEH|nr:pantoate--beta-alanine ligase [Alkalilimnicola ehrlichii]Q0AB68.1 RecName: Full=Pantothenate synthetase; Short=PS; AltName: Full=Pantoate--beta-alanine ligase; AltName: Full=Pantoate-activating enzyme [Alkalilimnicola ehrlichii MLHE-1]ABI55919.1 pantothenate synthetase [Alkalilimnicola ehrlichii MLHE-1]